MATVFIEPGGDADFGTGLWPLTSTTAPVVAIDFTHGSHVKSLKFAKASSFVGTSGVVDAGLRTSHWIYLNALPSGTVPILTVNQVSVGSVVAELALTAAGVLIFGNGSAQLGSNGPTLSTGQWYRISYAQIVTSVSVNQFAVWVNGVSAITVTNGSLINKTSADVLFGNPDGDTSLDMRGSDFYVDSSTAMTDPGNILVTAKRPVSNGTTNQFTTQVGASGSGYGSGHTPQVNERPLSNVNAWSISTAAKQTEEYTIEAASVGDIDISSATIVDYMGWIDAKEASTANSPVAHIIVGSVATAITLTTTNKFFTHVAGSTTYPTGGTDIGMDGQYTTTAHIFTLNECGIVFAYIPATGSNKGSFFF